MSGLKVGNGKQARMWIELESWGDRQGPLQSRPCFVDSGLDPEAVETRGGLRAGSSPVRLPLRKVSLPSEGKWLVGGGGGGGGRLGASAVGQRRGQG